MQSLFSNLRLSSIALSLFVTTLDFAAISSAASGENSSRSVAGVWKTIDDVSGQEKALVKIIEKDGALNGVITKLFHPERPNPICVECSGEKKDKPVEGMEIVWDMQKAGDNEWSGGRILDPKTGKVYKCRIRLADGGRKLEVRGFIGLSLFGRTQTWHREAPEVTPNTLTQ